MFQVVLKKVNESIFCLILCLSPPFQTPFFDNKLFEITQVNVYQIENNFLKENQQQKDILFSLILDTNIKINII